MKNSFILHHDTLSVIEELTDEQTGKLIKEIYAYSMYINNPKEAKKPTGLNGLMNSVLHPFKMQLDRDFDKYLTVLERNAKNGKKGGRPSKVENPKKPKKADSVKDSDSDSVKVNDNDKDFEKLWSLYNHKKSKASSVKVYNSKSFKRTDKEIEIAITRYLRTVKDKQYQKHFSTFLNSISDWLEDYEEKNNNTPFANQYPDIKHF